MPDAAVQVSIVMTYFERAEQLRTTLESFAFHGYGPEVEVVVADDGSQEAPAAALATSGHRFRVKVLSLPRAEKWWRNPCIPFNRAIAASSGPVVLLQNAECLHHGDVLAHARANLRRGLYLSYGCYSIGKETFDTVRGLADFSRARAAISIGDRAATFNGDDGWYNHSAHRPAGYHFCCAIRREDLDALGGFDERYAHGVGYDDDELLFRIRRMGLEVRIVDDPFVVHQWHYTAPPDLGPARALGERNKLLFKWVTRRGMSYGLFRLALGARAGARAILGALGARTGPGGRPGPAE